MGEWLRAMQDGVRAQVARLRGEPQARRVHGVPVTVDNPRPDIETDFVLRRLDEALTLIERHQPWRLAHLRRDIARIAIAPFPCRGAYLPGQHIVLTELSFLARAAEFTPAQLASSIVHEGMHARVHRMRERLGFDAAGHDAAREERLCRRSELAFGEALPPAMGAPVVARAIQSLQLSDEEVAPRVDWNAAHAAKAQADAEAIRAWQSARDDSTHIA